jgi:catechol 2,3-dioxygenase-like lactoylglutathione lyase family enzyme
MAIRTTGLDHIHVFARDLDGLLKLFGRLFECEYTQQSEIESVEAYNSTMRFTGATSSPYLDLFQPSTETGHAALSFKRMGEGVAVLSFGVEDLEAAAAHAESCGLRVVSRYGFPGVMSQVQFDPADTFGFQLELVQYEPDAPERIAEIQRKKAAGEAVDGLRLRPRTIA